MSLKPPVSKNDHIQGSIDAALELVEYGDYQCPSCRRAHAVVKTIQKKFGNNLKFVFRNFPLSEAHPQAKIAAVAAEAAALQGKFWEMHDIIFENQSNLLLPSLVQYAQQLGLDLKQFEADLKNEVLTEKVEADFESGLRSGVNGTPGFFINGEKYSGNWGEDKLSAYLKSQLPLLS
jgi:protein-disulfide isomerase